MDDQHLDHLCYYLDRQDFSPAIHYLVARENLSYEVAKQRVYALARELGVLTAELPTFYGHCPNLPVKRDMIVTIPKGTMIHNLHTGKKPAGRTYKVKVHFVHSGMEAHVNYHGDKVGPTNPRIEWAGTGGYWSSCDLNDIPEIVFAFKAQRESEQQPSPA